MCRIAAFSRSLLVVIECLPSSIAWANRLQLDGACNPKTTELLSGPGVCGGYVARSRVDEIGIGNQTVVTPGGPYPIHENARLVHPRQPVLERWNGLAEGGRDIRDGFRSQAVELTPYGLIGGVVKRANLDSNSRHILPCTRTRQKQLSSSVTEVEAPRAG